MNGALECRTSANVIRDHRSLLMPGRGPKDISSRHRVTTVNKLVISMVYVVAYTWPLCSAQIWWMG